MNKKLINLIMFLIMFSSEACQIIYIYIFHFLLAVVK